MLSLSGYSAFFENTIKIRSIITGVQPEQLTDEERHTLTRMFVELQYPFEMFRGDRKNFLAYSYTIYKLCEMKGYTRFLPYLPLLKAPQNLIRADKIWKKMCEYLGEERGYKFYPTDPDAGMI